MQITVTSPITETRAHILYPDLQQALTRVGRTPEAQARWLLEFARADLEKLSRGDWLNVWSDVLAFALVEEGAPPFPLFLPPPRVLRRWQADARQRLTAIAEGRSWTINLGPQRYELSVRHGALVAGRVWIGEALWAHLRQTFLGGVVRALGNAGERFRVCQRCGRPFIKRKRQTYCTSQCSQLVRTHKYRRAHRERLRTRRRTSSRERPSGRSN